MEVTIRFNSFRVTKENKAQQRNEQSFALKCKMDEGKEEPEKSGVLFEYLLPAKMV